MFELEPNLAMRILVLGGTGMLGHVLVRTLEDAGHSVTATVRGGSGTVSGLFDPGKVIATADLSAPGALAEVFDTARPDAVVNCVGMIKQKAGTGDAADMIRLNALLPHIAAAQAAAHGARLIHISTDCVFSGARGMYAESDAPDPPDAYGMTKLLGEVPAPHLTLRTSLIGWQVRGAESLLAWFWSQGGRQARGFSNAVFSGFSTRAFARILAAILRDHPRLEGLWHVAAPPIDKFTLLSGLNDRLGRPVDLIPDASVVIDRSLDGRRFAAKTAMTLPDWPAMLDELALTKADAHDH
jgi:dTDP-4-dehydrorhamnose reductase